MNYKLQNLEQKVKALSNKKSQLEGRCSLLEEQINDLEIKIIDQKDEKELFAKCIEFVNFVQASNQEIVKQSFENIVTNALHYVLAEDYSFKLDFSKRGSFSELNFNVLSPGSVEPKNLMDTESGGVLDVVSLALRLVLLEISAVKGPLILDESMKHLSVQYQQKANLFLKFINEQFHRQVIFISHIPEFINNPDYNTIEIGE